MRENEIRPQRIHDELLRYTRQDIQKFIKFDEFPPPPLSRCPGCLSEKGHEKFLKSGFCYRECEECRSLFVSPRPTLKMMDGFYRDGEASKYFAEVFIPEVIEKRRNLIFKPRVENIEMKCALANIDPTVILEIGAGHGIFLEEWKKKNPTSKPMAIEPNGQMAQLCRDKGIEVLEESAEKATGWDEVADVAVCFEVFEHIIEIDTFLKSIYKFIKPGGMIVITTLSVSGFDIQILGEKSKAIAPPQHLNFCTEKGFRAAFKRCGFENVDVTTPGELDVDIVSNMMKTNRLSLSNFERQLMTSDDSTKGAFQKFLQENRLSSHAMIIAFRPH